MDNVTHLGLDVHKETIAVGLLRPQDPVPDYRVIDNTPEAVRKLVSKADTASSLFACYEAGPTGYDTYRLLQSLGVRCDVIAPALIPHRAGQRVKTDRLDARNLARLHRAGELTPIRVPSSEEEALRDLIRVREDLKDDRRRAQQRVKSFLLRQGRRFPGSSKAGAKSSIDGSRPSASTKPPPKYPSITILLPAALGMPSSKQSTRRSTRPLQRLLSMSPSRHSGVCVASTPCPR